MANERVEQEHLEPGSQTFFSPQSTGVTPGDITQVSIAMSMKRFADAAEHQAISLKRIADMLEFNPNSVLSKIISDGVTDALTNRGISG